MAEFEILPEAPTKVSTKEWLETATTKSHLRMQEKIVTFLLWAYGCSLAATTLIFFLQGFHALGFALDLNILGWLGGATIGEIGGLLLLTFRVVFGRIRG